MVTYVLLFSFIHMTLIHNYILIEDVCTFLDVSTSGKKTRDAFKI